MMNGYRLTVKNTLPDGEESTDSIYTSSSSDPTSRMFIVTVVFRVKIMYWLEYLYRVIQKWGSEAGLELEFAWICVDMLIVFLDRGGGQICGFCYDVLCEDWACCECLNWLQKMLRIWML